MFGLTISFLFLFLIFLIFATMAYAALSAAPFVPLRKRDVKRMLELARVEPGELLYDLGSGDGRILTMAARKFKAKAQGFEISLVPLFLSYLRVLLSGQSRKIKIKAKNFYNEDLSKADVITCFLMPKALKKLKLKFEQELKPGSRVVSYAFSLPQREPDRVDKPDSKLAKVYLYRY